MIILDTSVLIKWYVSEKEEDVDKALKLLEKHVRNEEQIAVPTYALYEFAQTLIRKRKFMISQFRRVIKHLYKNTLKVIRTSSALIVVSAQIATAYNVEIYDAIFMAAAKKLSCELITADEKCYKTTKNLSYIKLLRDYTV